MGTWISLWRADPGQCMMNGISVFCILAFTRFLFFFSLCKSIAISSHCEVLIADFTVARQWLLSTMAAHNTGLCPTSSMPSFWHKHLAHHESCSPWHGCNERARKGEATQLNHTIRHFVNQKRNKRNRLVHCAICVVKEHNYCCTS